MPLPEGIPTVTLTGRFLTPDGRPLAGQVVLRAPSLITFEQFDVILGGPVTAPLDSTGAFEVELPATDAPGMDPSGWSYQVAEQLTGVPTNRIYQILLPSETPAVDLADIAPTDPSTPTYVAVRGDSAYEVAVANGYAGTVEQWLASLIGPQGAKGDPGSRIYTGSSAPTASLGTDGDLYTQHETTTVLNTPSTTVTNWRRQGGTWATVGDPVRGAAIYVNNATGTPITGTRPGDLLIRSDSGDLFQRGTTLWETKGNIKGPKGDKGDTGPEGPRGPAGADGTGSGTVTAVNGVEPDASGLVTLAPGDVGAVPAAGGTFTGKVAVRGDGAANVAEWQDSAGVARTRVGPGGNFVAESTAYFNANVQVGTTAAINGGGAGVIALKNAATLPTSNPTDAAILYADAGQLKVRQANGTVVTVGAGSSSAGRNVWTPQSLGFQAWSVDPAAVANPVQKPAVVGRIYLSGIHITEPTPVNRVVIHARGWGGSALVPAARFYAGIYNEAGSRIATSGQVSNLPAAGQISGSAPGAVNNHVGAVPVPLTGTVTLQPGRYWAAFLMSAGASTDFYYMHIQNESPSNPGNFFLGSTAFQRHWCVASGQTSLPATVNQSTGEVGLDPAIMALALV